MGGKKHWRKGGEDATIEYDVCKELNGTKGQVEYFQSLKHILVMKTALNLRNEKKLLRKSENQKSQR